MGQETGITTRAARLACRALLMALDECALGNVSAHARQLARAEALTSLRALLDGPAPAGRAPRARLEVV